MLPSVSIQPCAEVRGLWEFCWSRTYMLPQPHRCVNHASLQYRHEASPLHCSMCLCRPLIQSVVSIQALMAFVPFLTMPTKALCIVFFLCSACTVMANMIIFCHHHALSGYILVKSAFKSLEKVSFSI